jgi:N-dimethylarginine dimethylaminohydrolase
MIKNKTYHASDIHFTADDLPARAEPRNVLLCTPDYFDIVDVKNIHMLGNTGTLQKDLAVAQWHELKNIYHKLAAAKILQQVYIIQGVADCEDMVFAANQSFPWMLNGRKTVVMSKMRHQSRQREVPYFEKFYENLGYDILHLQQASMFEGMGDTIPHYGKNLLYGGYGHRSDIVAYQEISELLQVPVVTLELIDERFYHLDTCFIPVDENTVFLCRDAFTAEGIEALKKLFKNIIEIPVDEAVHYFALNAHCINDQVTGRRCAIIQKGTVITRKLLQEHGYEVIETDTSEYIKSGGSVFCMKMMLY